MKKMLFFAATAMLFAACSSDEAFAPETAQQAPQAVAFDTYTAEATRAAYNSGKVGVMNTTELQKATGGFGVFAQYSDGTPGAYAAATGSNFMWNQKVAWNSTTMGWEYSPLKYWPNETKNDSQDPLATMGTRVDKLTFFAYAPYVAHASTDDGRTYGELTGVTYTTHVADADQTGIIQVTGNAATTDPKVTYRVTTDPSKTVDLLWGVAPAGGLSYATVNKDYAGTDNATLTVAEGMPLINLIKPSKDQKMKFLFKHALSRINFKVVGAFDQIAPGGSKSTTTKVLVEQVDVLEEVAGSIKTYGVLNLNNTSAGVALWDSRTGGTYTTTPLFSVSGADITASILDGGDVAFASQPAGVTTSETNLFADAADFFAVIPNDPSDASDKTQFVFEITYYVQTQDAELKASGSVDGSRVKNVVRVPVAIHLENNKSYNFRLILGLTSVKLDAEVADWTVAGNVDANLPRNND